MALTKTQANKIHSEVNDAIRGIAEKYGLQFDGASTRWNADRLVVKTCELKALAPLGGMTSAALAACLTWGVNPEAWGPKGERIVDYTGRGRGPWVLADPEGKRYTAGIDYVRCFIGGSDGAVSKTDVQLVENLIVKPGSEG